MSVLESPKLKSCFDLNFNNEKHEELFEQSTAAISQKQNLLLQKILFILHLLVIIFLYILKLVNTEPRKEYFLSFSLNLVGDSLILSLLVIAFLSHSDQTVTGFAQKYIEIVTYVQIIFPFQIISGSYMTIFRFSPDHLFLILSIEFLVRYIYISLCKCSFDAIFKSTVLLLIYQWTVLTIYHKFGHVINYLFMFTSIIIILSVICYLKEKDRRNQFLKELELKSQREHYENMLNGLKIGIFMFDGKKSYFNNALVDLANKVKSKNLLANTNKKERSLKIDEKRSSTLLEYFFKNIIYDDSNKLYKENLNEMNSDHHNEIDFETFWDIVTNNIESFDPNLDPEILEVLKKENKKECKYFEEFELFKLKLKQNFEMMSSNYMAAEECHSCQSRENPMNQMNPMNSMNSMNQTKQMKQMNQMNQMIQMDQMKQMNQIQPMSQIHQMNSTSRNSEYIKLGVLKLNQKSSSNSLIEENTQSDTQYYAVLARYNPYSDILNTVFSEEGVEFILQDITDTIKIEQTKQNIKQKQLLLAKIAHEFKSPISTIGFLCNTIYNKMNFLNLVQHSEVHSDSSDSDENEDQIALVSSSGIFKKPKSLIKGSLKNNLSEKSFFRQEDQNDNNSLRFIVNLCDYLLMLVEDLNSYVKFKDNPSGKNLCDHKDVTFKQVNIFKALEFCYSIYYFKQKNDKLKKNLRIELKIDENAPKYIYTNEIKLKQTIINLMSNAYKFTASGKVTLKAAIVEKTKEVKPAKSNTSSNFIFSNNSLYENNTQMLRISIIDTGSGISREEKEQLFKPFHTLSRNQKMNTNGSGLGLLIVKEMLAQLKSSIFLESDVTKGTCFYFELDVNNSQNLNNLPSDNISSKEVSILNITPKKKKKSFDKLVFKDSKPKQEKFKISHNNMKSEDKLEVDEIERHTVKEDSMSTVKLDHEFNFSESLKKMIYDFIHEKQQKVMDGGGLDARKFVTCSSEEDEIDIEKQANNIFDNEKELWKLCSSIKKSETSLNLYGDRQLIRMIRKCSGLNLSPTSSALIDLRKKSKSFYLRSDIQKNSINTNMKNLKKKSCFTSFKSPQNKGASSNRSFLRSRSLHETNNLKIKKNIAKKIVRNNSNCTSVEKSKVSSELDIIKKLKIMICDDEVSITASMIKLSMRLSKELVLEFDTEVTHNAVDCLSKIFKDYYSGIKYDVLFIDETMPFMRGSLLIQLLKNIACNKELNHIKIISITGYEDINILNYIKSYGCDGFLKKPVRYPDFKEFIKKFICV